MNLNSNIMKFPEINYKTQKMNRICVSKKLVLLLIILLNINAFSQNGINSTINAVTVFKQNAEITRIANIKLIAGTQEIVFTGTSTSINPSSLQVQVESDNVTLLSAKYELNYLEPNKNNIEVEELKVKLTDLEEELSWLDDQSVILKGMEDVLNKNQDLGGNNAGFTPNQVIEMSNAYKTKFLEIRKEVRVIKKQTKKLKEEKNKIQNQLNEMNTSFNKPTGSIVLKIDSKTALQTNLKYTYVVNNAGWNPLYDLRSEGITKNVKLNYKANVYQNTGEEWNNVNLTVSTGNPSQNNDRPILSPLFTQIYTEPHYHGNDSHEEIIDVARRAGKNKSSVSSLNMAYEDEAKKEKDAYKYNAQVSTNQINVEFNIVNQQTIKSDAKLNLIALDSYDLTTKYIYHAVPKINTGTYLLAKITNWGKHNLENGEANIFFEGKYIGKSFINSKVTSDTLLISMGRDNGINIQRKAIKEFKSSKFIGNNKKETFGYDIIVKNKKTIPIEIEILDQIPVSQNKLIDVELVDKSGAKYTENTGKLLWKLQIEPQQSIGKKLIYSVKYPKKVNVSGVK